MDGLLYGIMLSINFYVVGTTFLFGAYLIQNNLFRMNFADLMLAFSILLLAVEELGLY
jgi:hypothetical protein